MFDFNPEEILSSNNVEVTWLSGYCKDGWALTWKHGTVYIGPCTELKAQEAAAIFVLLWLKGVPAQISVQLIIAYTFIESYHDAICQYGGLINDIEHFAREGHEALRGSITVQPE